MTRFQKTIGCLFALTLALQPVNAEAQRRGRTQQQAPPQGWPSVTIGGHFGYDDNSSGEVVGAQIRIPIVRSANFELMPSGDVTFLPGLKEYQFNADVLYVTGGRRGGLYAGGGLALRNTLFPGGTGRQTQTGWGWIAGIRSSPSASVGMQLEVRQIYVDEALKPRLLTFGVNFPLWGSSDGRPGGR